MKNYKNILKTSVNNPSFKKIAKLSETFFKDFISRTPVAHPIDKILKNIFTGYISLVNYKLEMILQESTLRSATRANHIYKLANDLGYNINRFTAPIIRIKYLGKNPTSILPLTKVGVLKDNSELGLYYIGDKRILTFGEQFDVILGYLNQKEVSNNNPDKLWIETIKPTKYKSIDNDAIFTGFSEIADWQNSLAQVSLIPDGFLFQSRPYAQSLDVYSANIYISNKDYGITNKNQTTIFWIETDGKINQDYVSSHFDILLPDFHFLHTANIGSNGDSLDIIKSLAPIYHRFKGVMGSFDSYSVIIKKHPFIQDVKVIKDLGKPEIVSYDLANIPKTELGKEIGFVFGSGNFTERITVKEDKMYYVPEAQRKYFYTTPQTKGYGDSSATLTPEIIAQRLATQINGRYMDGVFAKLDGSKITLYGTANSPYLIRQEIGHMSNPLYVNKNIIQKAVIPSMCCKLDCYYIHHLVSGEDNPKFNESEATSISRYVNEFKTTQHLVFIPAIAYPLDLEFEITFLEGDKSEIETTLRSLIEKQIYLVGNNLDLAEVLYELSRLYPLEITGVFSKSLRIFKNNEMSYFYIRNLNIKWV